MEKRFFINLTTKPNSIGDNMISISKSPKFLLLFLVSIIFLFPLSAFSQEKPIARLADFSGTVLVKSQGSWGVKPVKNLPLYSMDKLVTRIGNATIVFNDGATVNIKNNSNLLINEQEKTKGLVKTVERHIMLFLGRLNFKTGKSAVETRFETTRAVIGIRGTAGILSIGADGKTYIYFSEGGAKYILGEFIRGIAKPVRVALADKNPIQRATFVAKAAIDQVARTEKMVAAGKMTAAQLDLAKAIAKETSALETLTLAESMLGSPDKKQVEWAKQQITTAKEKIKEAKKDQKNAIKNGADPAFKGFTTENPGFNVPLDQNKQGSKS
jgi:hypothetical protein